MIIVVVVVWSWFGRGWSKFVVVCRGLSWGVVGCRGVVVGCRGVVVGGRGSSWVVVGRRWSSWVVLGGVGWSWVVVGGVGWCASYGDVIGALIVQTCAESPGSTTPARLAPLSRRQPTTVGHRGLPKSALNVRMDGVRKMPQNAAKTGPDALHDFIDGLI